MMLDPIIEKTVEIIKTTPELNNRTPTEKALMCSLVYYIIEENFNIEINKELLINFISDFDTKFFNYKKNLIIFTATEEDLMLQYAFKYGKENRK